jgi:hypothetical protein
VIQPLKPCFNGLQLIWYPLAGLRAAGCALVLPGEFGTDSSEYPPGSFMYFKRTAIAHLEQIGLTYLRVFVGLLPETTISPKGLGFDFANSKAHLPPNWHR